MDVQADRERVGRRVGPQPGSARRHHPLAEYVRLGGPLVQRVEVLQRIDEVGEGVKAEAALGWTDAGQPHLARLRVGPPGRSPREAVDRPEPGHVAVVAVVELPAQIVDLGAVVDGGRLGFQQPDHGVA